MSIKDVRSQGEKDLSGQKRGVLHCGRSHF